MRVFVISLVSYICVGCQTPNKIRSLLGSVLSLIDALQGVPIVCKTNWCVSTVLHERSPIALFLRLVSRFSLLLRFVILTFMKWPVSLCKSQLRLSGAPNENQSQSQDLHSCPVTQRQLPVNEDVISVVAQCYTDPGKIATSRLSEMFPPSFGVRLTEILFSFLSVPAQWSVGDLRNMFGELCNVENTVTIFACVHG